MSSLKTRAARITTGVAALAVGAALVLPATALAAPALADNPMTAFAANTGVPIKVNQPELTANGNSAKTSITMTLPSGQDLCFGPFVYKGTLTNESDQGGAQIYPNPGAKYGAVASRLVIASGAGLVFGATGQTLTESAALGNGDSTAVMVCMSLTDASNPSSPTNATAYVRHIKDGQGVGGNNTPSALGSLGSLFMGSSGSSGS